MLKRPKMRYLVRVVLALVSILALLSCYQWCSSGKVLWPYQTVAIWRMGVAYTSTVYQQYGTIIAPTAAAHQQVTDEMTIDGDDMGTFQRKHGLTVGNNSSGIILSWWWRIANE